MRRCAVPIRRLRAACLAARGVAARGALAAICFFAAACGPAEFPDADVVRIVAPALAAEGMSPATLLDGKRERAVRIGPLEPRRPDRPGRERAVFDATGGEPLGRLLLARAGGVLHYHVASHARGFPAGFFEPNRLVVLQAGDATQLALWFERNDSQDSEASVRFSDLDAERGGQFLALAQALGAWSLIASDRSAVTAEGEPRLPFFLPERPGDWRSLSQRSLAFFLPPALARAVAETPGFRARAYRSLNEFSLLLPALAEAEQRVVVDLAGVDLTGDAEALRELLSENFDAFQGYLDSSWIELAVHYRPPDAARIEVYVHSVGDVLLTALAAPLKSKFLMLHGTALSGLTLRGGPDGAQTAAHLGQDALEFRVATEVASRPSGPYGFAGVRLEYELVGLAPLGEEVWRLLDGLEVQATNAITGAVIPADHHARIASLEKDRFLVGEEVAPDAFVALQGSVLQRKDGGASLRFDAPSAAFVLAAGVHVLSGDLFLPAGYGLVIEAGAELRISPGVSLLVRGPLHVRGTEERPVRVRGVERGAAWGVLAVQGRGRAGLGAARPRSTIRHLELSGGSEDWLKGVFYSGQLSLYHGDLEMEHAILSHAFADDALNVKYGDVAIRDSFFVDNAADGIDLDWVSGVVRRSFFGRGGKGGDGIDVSGSQILVEDCVFSDLRDKCLSVGEASSLDLRGSLLRSCEAGVASKDQSVTRVERSVFLDNERNFVVYRKKQIFGGGQLRGDDLILGEAKKPDSDDAESLLELTHVRGLKSARARELRGVSQFSEAAFEALAGSAKRGSADDGHR